jgi:RNA polymerase sigma-70 factor (ECF subfamily)
MVSIEGDSDGLMDRLERGDPRALAELFSRHRDQLRRMVALRLDHRLNGRVSPSDVLQEAYIDALRRVPHYFAKPDMPFFGWLRLVVGQRLVDVHRQHLGARLRDAGQEVSLQAGTVPAASAASLAAHLVAHLTSPSEAAVRNEASAQLEEALNRLEPLDREVLTLRHFEELGNNEVADLLGITRAAASKRYVRALARLKEVLANIPGFFDEPP